MASKNYAINVVPPSFVNTIWKVIYPMVQSAIDLGDASTEEYKLYSMDNIRGYMTSGEWLTLVAVDDTNKIYGVAVISFVNYPFHRVAYIVALAGNLVTSQSSFDQFDDILRQHGATMIQAHSREAVIRLWRRYGFKKRHALMERLL